ncbi:MULTISPECIES: hypothetical protein [unclassified Gilliamella]|uniref:hypothetical protein n=1 Tax=unclassified Gilliamella TaxID=2685620 RepID=UPI002269AE20|nr:MULTISPECIES: hypothetical protein [unclassified Gilliamella]MCX8598580.1 hypothetical protein [Gilliamella sp. B3486]MCX8689412.1 hypothetical protein [Gilliamella sp. B2973]MCX8705114.1 hypothetical protein [Gilliamella sp. B3127]
MHKIIILLTLTLWLGCSYGQPIITYTPATPDTAKDLSGALISPPLGQRAILHKAKNEDFIADLHHDIFFKYSDKESICSLLGCGETVIYTPELFKEEYSELSQVFDQYNLFKKEDIPFTISSKYLKKGDIILKFALQSNSTYYKLSMFLLSFKNGVQVDSKRILYNRSGPMGFTDCKIFYIDENFIISTRVYEFNEEEIVQTPFYQYQLNDDGKFIRYYPKNGNYRDNHEQGLVKNHTREGLWIEKKVNHLIGPSYFEAEYKNGLIQGEGKFYKLEYKLKDGSIPYYVPYSSAKKGKLLYTETYKDGELVERKFVDKQIDELN